MSGAASALVDPRAVVDGPPLPAAKIAEDYAAGLDWLLTGIATRK
jgi:hypothetical protein